MKHKHMFSLLDQSFTTVHVVFATAVETLPPGQYDMVIEHAEIEERPAPWISPAEARKRMRVRTRIETSDEQSYVYKVPRAWGVREDDHLVVLNSSGILKVVTVVKADSSPDIDVDADFDYKWAVCKVDVAEFHELNRKEKSFATTMLEIERTKQRESLVQSFRDSLPEGSEARRLFEQTTGHLAPPPAPPPPQQPPTAPPFGAVD